MSRNWHTLLAVLTHLAEGLDLTLLFTLKMEKPLIDLVGTVHEA
jgi:hypothetical protein